MSDKRSISEIMEQVSKKHRATLEKLSRDSDGKDDFTEGVSYFDQLQKIDLPEETIENFEKIFQTHRSFWDRVQLFLKDENQAGRWAKVIKDFALIFVPYGKQISTVTEFINQRLIPDAMAQQNEGIFQKSIRFLKQESTRRGIAFVVGLIGAWLSIDIQPELLIQSVIGILSGLSLIYAAWKNIKDIFTDEDQK